MELIRALGALAEPPAPEHAPLAKALGLPAPSDGAAYAQVFAFQLYPYASVYLGPEGMLGGVARDRIAGFWTAVGRAPPPEPDHLAALLGLYAGLLDEAAEVDEAAAPLVARSAGALLHEHLLPWLPPFLDRVRELGGPFFRAWAEVLGDALRTEAGHWGEPAALSRHLTEAPGLPDPRTEGGPAFVAGLLAPIRTGVILARHDLARLARSLELPLRAGERRYVLEHLLGMEAAAVLHGVADHAAAARVRHGEMAALWGGPAAFWAERARATEALLRDLAEDGVDVVVSNGARAEAGA